MNVPVRFPGTPEEIEANLATHIFVGYDGERCLNCDCRPSYISATWPCGAKVPREDI
jgi:hypothetical protein